VTDAAAVLGWLDPAQPLASDLRIDPGAAERAVGALAHAAGLDLQRCAEGIVEVVVANMVRALRRVSVERGLDPRAMTLVPFGGAGPLFTCRMADALGMTRALVPPHPGVLSALGLAAAPARVERLASVHRLVADLSDEDWRALVAPVGAAVERELPEAALAAFADCRYPGQGYEVSVGADEGRAALTPAFHAAHRARFGHADPARAVEIVNVRVVGSADRRIGGSTHGRSGGLALLGNARLEAGTAFVGPVTIALEDATVRIEDGWAGRVHETGAIVVEKTPGASGEREDVST
jgi:N-methylhydantoinase A